LPFPHKNVHPFRQNSRYLKLLHGCRDEDLSPLRLQKWEVGLQMDSSYQILCQMSLGSPVELSLNGCGDEIHKSVWPVMEISLWTLLSGIPHFSPHGALNATIPSSSMFIPNVTSSQFPMTFALSNIVETVIAHSNLTLLWKNHSAGSGAIPRLPASH
jgi:hypothetical protein